MPKVYILLLLCCAIPHLALCQTNIYMISAMDGELLLENGSTTNFWGYGWQTQSQEIELPAPLLHFEEGEEVIMHMNNISPEAHTIHLHGMDVNQANDGVPQTSFQVMQNQSGEYSFTATHSGTYLYHCHVTTTLHLTMGMYGMIVVDGPDNTLYAGGPGFNVEREYLFSDLMVEVNDAPALAYPFHDIYPDYFMVNGLQGTMITDDLNQHLSAHIGDSVAVRLGSMAYSLIKVKFPEGSNPVTYMSDGRVLPNVLTVSELEIYPGERFTTVFHPDASFSGNMAVEYYSMLSKELIHTNFVPVQNLGVSVSESQWNELLIFPNPASDVLHIQSPQQGNFAIFNAQGKWISSHRIQSGVQSLSVEHLSPGMYFISNGVGMNMTFVKW